MTARRRSLRGWWRTFARDGFVVVPDLLTTDELVRFGAAVDEGVARRSRHDARTVAEKSRYEQSFIQCQNLWEDCDEVRPLTFHPLIAETAARLLGVAAVRIWHDQALYKEAGGRETDPHQDQPYWPIVETNTITAWIPFDGSTLESGAMGYLPGSHRLGVREFVDIFTGSGDDPLARDELAGIERCSSRCHPGRSPSTTASRSTWPSRTGPVRSAGCTPRSTSPTGPPGARGASRIPRWSGRGSPWAR